MSNEFKIARSFINAIAKAAMELSDENPRVILDSPYTAFTVSLKIEPGEKATKYTYQELDIEREGEFYLAAKSILG